VNPPAAEAELRRGLLDSETLHGRAMLPGRKPPTGQNVSGQM
jgi:hypothetical protein